MAEEILKGTFKQGNKILVKAVEGSEELIFVEDDLEEGVSHKQEEKTGASEG